MSYLLKDPDALLDYRVDWAKEYLGDDRLATSDWSIAPEEAGGVSLAASDFDGANAVATVRGGLPGRLYRLTNEVTTAAGLRDRRSVILRVEKR